MLVYACLLLFLPEERLGVKVEFMLPVAGAIYVVIIDLLLEAMVCPCLSLFAPKECPGGKEKYVS
jgi:hypothetical protein